MLYNKKINLMKSDIFLLFVIRHFVHSYFIDIVCNFWHIHGTLLYTATMQHMALYIADKPGENVE